MREAMWVGAGIALVLGSSLLGLGTPMALGGLNVFVEVWTASLLADLVFVAGTLGVGVACVLLARARHAAASVVVGLLGQWQVYAASWLLVLMEINGDPGWGSSGEVYAWVARWGWPGLLFAGITPAVFERFTRAPVRVSPELGPLAMR